MNMGIFMNTDDAGLLPVTDRDSKIMGILRSMAEDVAPVANARLAAAVAIRGNIISFGHNSLRSHPWHLRWGKNRDSLYWHAETNAIYNFLKRRPPQDLAKSTLYVLRIKRPHETSRDWVMGMARPCKGCQKCIMDFAIPRVVYSTNEQTFMCE
jgi:deoxycytidylate deaminase